MMQIKVTAPAQIHTTIQLPSSKSISNRALIINALGIEHSNLKTYLTAMIPK